MRMRWLDRARRSAAAVPVFVVALVLVSAPIAAEPQAAWTALRQGGSVALMRHAEAPGGAGDPAGFKLDDCATQRNLSATGRAQASAAGAMLKAQGVSLAKILASPWCRCVETARLMELGPVQVADAFSNAFVLHQRRDALKEGARAIIDAWTSGTLLVVTHGANIQALTGDNPASGEIIVVAPRSGASLRVIGRILPAAAER
jgi:phosphohistidine phosphatase SixA